MYSLNVWSAARLQAKSVRLGDKSAQMYPAFRGDVTHAALDLHRVV
jgi:hypothetical protein